jgi:hypothetical protein
MSNDSTTPLPSDPAALIGMWDRVVGDHAEESSPHMSAETPPADPPSFARREVLPMNSGDKRCAYRDIIEIDGCPKRPAFRPERFFIQNAHAWEVVDILVDDKTQFLQPGPIPGEIFASGELDAWFTCDTVQKDKSIRIVARYIGPFEEGIPFVGGILGTSAIDPTEL